MQESREILVVEDDEVLNSVVCRYVSIAGYDCRPALDGGAALHAIEESPPRLVLLDLMLPDISGFDICKQLKSDPRTSKVPVVMVTSLSDDESRRQGMACGASAYLTKPFDPDQLIQTIQRWAA
jgi:DNA-binding response OmpR family regulator